MANHPSRSKLTRTVTLKITRGGGLVRCQNATTSDLAVRVERVPLSVSDARVAVQLRKVVLLPPGGPWAVSWSRLADAVQGSVLRDCK